MKLVDVPELGYMTQDQPFPRGEVCLRGANVFLGYWRDEAKTRETIDSNHWLHTGDIGQLNADGTLSIIDRKKNLFKLSQGEYISPEKLEAVYSSSPLLQQVFVHGDALQSCVVAIVVPEPDAFVPWARQQLVGSDDEVDASIKLENLCTSPIVRAATLRLLAGLASSSGLNRFEFVRAVELEHRPFTVADGLLTPTMKLKRAVLRERYSDTLGRLYAEVNEHPNAGVELDRGLRSRSKL